MRRHKEGVEMIRQEDRSANLVVNLPDLLTRIENDRELLGELVDIFKQESPRLLKFLHEQVVREEWEQVESTSHGLKGMLGNLSANRAAATAARLEQMARERQLFGIANVVTELKVEVAKLLQELEASLTGTES